MILNNYKLPSPAWAVNAVAAATFIFQALPRVFSASAVVSDHTEAVIALSCDIANIVVAGFAIFIGTPKTKTDDKN